jgi:hypothetical protein
VLVCERRLAEFDRRRGDLRLADHIGALLGAGWQVSFLAFRRDADLRYARTLRQMGVAVTVGREHIEEVVVDLQPDLALPYMWFAGEQMLPWLRGRSPRTKVVVDTGDLHLLRTARTCFRRGGEGVTSSSGFGADAVRELNAYAAADAVLAVSERERALVDELTGRPGLASLVPLVEATRRSARPLQERRGIVFVGNFLHAPNREAIGHLLTEVLPRLEPGCLGGHPVLVLGYGLTPEIRDLAAGRRDVRMIGWVPDLTPYLHRARAVVVPLLTGAGVKGKLLQALAAGTPVVSTSVGIEGTGAVGGEHLLVADDPAAFASALTRLLADDALWGRLADAGHQLVRPYRPEVVDRILLDTLEAVVAGDHAAGPLVPGATQ